MIPSYIDRRKIGIDRYGPDGGAMNTQTPQNSQYGFNYLYRSDPMMGTMSDILRQNANVQSNPNLWGTGVTGRDWFGFGGAMQGAMDRIGGQLNRNADRVAQTRRLGMVLDSPMMKQLMGGGGGISGFTTNHGQRAVNPRG